MSNIRCTICESTDLVLKDGYYICEFCGNKMDASKVVESTNTSFSEVKSTVKESPVVTQAFYLAWAKINNIIRKHGNLIGININKGTFSDWIDQVQTANYSFNRIEVPQGFFDLTVNHPEYSQIYVGDNENKNPTALFKDSKLELLCKVIYNNRDAEWLHYGFDGKTVKKRGYNLSIRSKDKRYNQNIHDMNLQSLGDTLRWVVELSRTGKEYYINRIVPKNGFLGLLKNEDTVWTFSDLDVTKTFYQAKDMYDEYVNKHIEMIRSINEGAGKAQGAFKEISSIIDKLISKYGVVEFYSDLAIYLQILNIIKKTNASNIKEFEKDFKANYKLCRTELSDTFTMVMIDGFHIEKQIGQYDEELRVILSTLDQIEKSF